MATGGARGTVGTTLRVPVKVVHAASAPNLEHRASRIVQNGSIIYNLNCKTHGISLCINYFSTLALWAIQIEFSIARLKFK